MQNMDGIAANEATGLRELSLDEAEMVGGGFSWGGFFRGVQHLGSDVEHGMVEGAIIGGLGGRWRGRAPAPRQALYWAVSAELPKACSSS
jgi:hypothetical protein